MSYPLIPVRWQRDEPRTVRVLDLAPGHPLTGSPCPGCDRPIEARARVALVTVGPDDEESYARHREGRWYTAGGVMAHAGCAAAVRPATLQVRDDDESTASGTPS